MSFKQMMADDMSIFYNADEFAIAATFSGNSIAVLERDDIELASREHKVVSAKSSDVSGIKSGDVFMLEDENYKVLNFELKDSDGLEMLIALVKV